MEQFENNLTTVSVEEQVEQLCRWGAARAAALAACPKMGALGVIANDVYMVIRIARAYGKCPATGAVLGFLLGLGGTGVSALVCKFIPSRIVAVPVAAGLTYGVGKAAAAWIADGMSLDNVGDYRTRLVDIYEHNKETVSMLFSSPLKDKPLGDESVNFLADSNLSEGDFLSGAKDFASSFLSQDVLTNLSALKDVAAGAAGVAFYAIAGALGSNRGDVLDSVKHAAKGLGELLKVVGSQSVFLAGAAAEASKEKFEHMAEDSVFRVDEIRDHLNETLEMTVGTPNIKEKVEPIIEKAQDVAAVAVSAAADAGQKAKELVDKVKG